MKKSRLCLAYSCPRCGAKKGERCVTSLGTVANAPHTGRLSQVPKVKRKRGDGRIRAERHVEHGGVRWTSYSGSAMWTWSPWVPESFVSVYVYDLRPEFGISVSFKRCSVKVASLEEAFDLAPLMVQRDRFLDTLRRRSEWRIRELERRFGAQL